MGKIWLWVIVPFCSVFILTGAYLIFQTGKKIYGGVLSKSWKTTEGKIVSSEIEEKKDSDGDKTYEVTVTYQYYAEGIGYSGSRIHHAYNGSGDETIHEEIFKKLKKGNRVVVLYNPSNPKDATLTSGFYSLSLGGLFGGSIFFFVGLGFLLTFLVVILGSGNFAEGIRVLGH